MPRRLPWLHSTESPTPQSSTLPLAEVEDPFASDSDIDEVIELTQDDDDEPWVWRQSSREAQNTQVDPPEVMPLISSITTNILGPGYAT